MQIICVSTYLIIAINNNVTIQHTHGTQKKHLCRTNKKIWPLTDASCVAVVCFSYCVVFFGFFFLKSRGDQNIARGSRGVKTNLL